MFLSICRKREIFPAILAACSVLVGLATGQDHWQNFTRGNVVTSLADSKEFIWVGTNGGAVKINKTSEERTLLTHANSGLPETQINDIAADDEGNLWFAAGHTTSSGGGLAKFDGSSWIIYNAANSDLPSNKISAITFSPNDDAWVGSNKGLLHIQENQEMIWHNTTNSELPDDRVLSLAVDFNGRIWVGTMGGLAIYDQENLHWTVYTTYNSPLPADEITCISIEEDVTWIGTRAGLVKFNGVNWEIFDPSNSALPNYFVNAIKIDDNGVKWIGTDGGLAVFDDSEWTVYDTSNSQLPNNQIKSILVDGNNIKWIGTSNNLSRFDESAWKLYHTSNSGLPNNIATAVANPSDSTLWVGTIDGLARYDGNFWTVFDTSNSGLPDNSVTCIAVDQKKISGIPPTPDPGQSCLWVGTYYGLARFSGNKWKIYNSANSGLVDNNISSIAIDAHGNKWIGTGHGLSKFDGRNWTTYLSSNSGLPDDFVTAVAVEEGNTVWIGTYNGLARFNGNNWQIFNAQNSGLPQNIITALMIDSENNKWIGCRDNVSSSLVKLNSEWTVYTAFNSGLPDANIESLEYDSEQDKIWIGTWMGGLTGFDGESWQTYNVFNSGLSHDIVNSITVDGRGKTWMATNWGLTFREESNSKKLNAVIVATTDLPGESGEPDGQSKTFQLFKNYPDPFNPTTTISYRLPRASNVKIEIFNMLGEKVRTLVNNRKEPGVYETIWDGRNDNGLQVGSGVYLYRMVAGEYVQTKRMVLVR